MKHNNVLNALIYYNVILKTAAHVGPSIRDGTSSLSKRRLLICPQLRRGQYVLMRQLSYSMHNIVSGGPLEHCSAGQRLLFNVEHLLICNVMHANYHLEQTTNVPHAINAETLPCARHIEFD